MADYAIADWDRSGRRSRKARAGVDPAVAAVRQRLDFSAPAAPIVAKLAAQPDLKSEPGQPPSRDLSKLSGVELIALAAKETNWPGV